MKKWRDEMETYTFSRTLHMMRYGGKRLGLETASSHECFYVENEKLYRSIKTNGKWDSGWACNGLPDSYIMGSWIEVKDEV